MDTVSNTARRYAKVGDLTSFDGSYNSSLHVENVHDGFSGEVAKALGIDQDVFSVAHRRITPRSSYTSYSSSFYNRTAAPVDPTKIASFIVIGLSRGGMAVNPVSDGIISLTPIKLESNTAYNLAGHSLAAPIFLEVGVNGQVIPVIADFKTVERLLGLRITDTGDLIGPTRVFKVDNISAFLNTGRASNDDLTFNSVVNAFSTFENAENALRVIRGIVRKGAATAPAIKGSGIDKVNKVVTPLAVEAAELDPLALVAYRTWAANTRRTIDGVRISALFNDIFGAVKNKYEFLAAIESFTTALFTPEKRHDGSAYWNTWRAFENAIAKLPKYIERRKVAAKSRSGAAFKRLMADIETITEKLDVTKYPKTFKAIQDGEIPVGTFFRTGNEIDGQYFLLNDNWQLWESMLKIDKATTIEIAKAASTRTTYEKDLMSYFYFVTKGLPTYLRKHTGKSWKCSPKLVDSPSELNPPTSDAGGTTRRRSALTPIVDNVKNTVIVPYASLAMPGRQVTYCYSHTYEVIKDGLSVGGNTATQDLEVKLNGRDDYGLMFFTLTGSDIGRGYPTFLIIFERLERGTRVHFHRTHPSRSKNGDINPIHNWIRTNYNWMIGNVRADRIKAQQGDLAFVTVDSEVGLEFNTEVQQYDHHCFDAPVKFANYTKAERSNILGYVKLDRETQLTHNEHDPRTIPAGTYEIRQARSWEANPAGVWSLRID